MPRPTLVIGIGGTGSKVLFWLKKDLLETYGATAYNQDDFPVKVLLIDTATDISNPLGLTAVQQNQFGGQNIVERLGGLSENNEIRYIPSNYTAAQTIAIFNGKDTTGIPNPDPFEHLRWLAPKSHFPAAALNLSNGASQYRQLGRLALLQALHFQGQNDVVYTTLQTRLSQIGNVRNEVDVHIVGSFVGGTGSGIFIDVALIIRRLIEQTLGGGITLQMFGHFALPRVFSAAPRLDMHQRTFNAWRELNRFMSASSDSPISTTWKPGFNYTLSKPLYDNVYLTDTTPAGAKPEATTYPMMGETISFFIDDQAGSTYIQHITQNLNKQKGQYPWRNQPVYSAVKLHVWKLPVHHTHAIASHNLALAYLTKLLDIQRQNALGLNGEPVVHYTIGTGRTLANRALEITSDDIPDIGNTAFLQDIVNIVSIQPVDRQRESEQVSLSITEKIRTFSILPSISENQIYNTRINEYLDWTPPNVETNGRTPDEIRRSIQSGLNQLYGQQRLGGEYSTRYGDFQENHKRGTFYKELQNARSFHLEMYKKRLWAWVKLTIATAVDADNGGGLPATKSGLKNMRSYLASTVEFYRDVLSFLPDPEAMNAQIKELTDNLIETLNGLGGFIAFLNRILGTIKSNVQSWHSYEVEHNDLRRNRRGVESIIETLTDLIEETDVAIQKVQEIEQQLVTGNNAMGVTSLYQAVEISRDFEDYRFGIQDNALGVTTRLGNPVLNLTIDNALIATLVGKTSWTLDAQHNLVLQILIDPNLPPIELSANLTDPNQTVVLVNTLTVELGRMIPEDDGHQTAMNYLQMRNFQQVIQSINTPPYVASAANTGQSMKTFYVRRQLSTNDQATAQDGQINVALGGIGLGVGMPGIGQLNSENHHRVVVFHAHELLLSENFNAFKEAKEAYRQTYRGDALTHIPANPDTVRYDHISNAEQMALNIEHRYSQANPTAPFNDNLDQRLVHLMSHYNNLKLFLSLWLTNSVVGSPDIGPQQHWHIQVNGTGNPVIACDYPNRDFIEVMSRFTNSQRDIYGNPITMQALRFQLHHYINPQSLRDAIVQRIDFEVKSARDYYTSINQQLQLASNNFYPSIQNVSGQLSLERVRLATLFGLPTIRTMADELALDFVRQRHQFDGGMSPIISNHSAHLHLLQVVIPVILEELKSWATNNPAPF